MDRLIRFSLMLLTSLIASFYAHAERITTYYINDPSGTPIMEMNEAGEITHYPVRMPFGEEYVAPGEQKTAGVGFTGHYQNSETGLVYMQARNYNPQLGMFYSFDPGNHNYQDPFAFGRYGYANQNPYKFIDPDGRDPIDILSALKGDIRMTGGRGKSFRKPVTPPMRLNPMAQGVAEATEQMAVKASKAIPSVTKSAYEAAKSGGKHAGFLKNYAGKSAAQLKKGIQGLQKQIDEHSALINDPAGTMKKLGKGDWNALDPRQQKALLERKWPGDIQRQTEQQNILKGLLDDL